MTDARVSDYKPKARLPQVKKAAELIGKQFAPIRWAIADLIPEGVVLMVGAPKLGKSWFMLQCGITISSGRQLWFGRRPELAGDVLMLALEDNERRLALRMKKLGATPADVRRLHVATEWPRADRGGVEALDEWLSNHPDCRLVVIDTLARWRGDARRSDSAYATDYNVGAQLKPLAERHRVALVLVHHSRKATSADVLDAVSGTLGLSGSVDGALILRRERGALDAGLYVTGRDIEHETDYALRFDPATCQWSGTGSVREAQVSRERREILEFLATNPLARPKQVADGLGKKSGAVRFLLHRMLADGEIKEIGGQYRTVPTLSLSNSANSGDSVSDIDLRGSSSVSGVSAVSAEVRKCQRCGGEGCRHCEVTP